jgi:hypothetical protein
MSGYPRNLSYFVRKLNNYSRNVFKLQTLNQSTASQSQLLTVDLPNNALVDLNTLTFWFKGTTTTTNSGASPPGFATFARNIESIIERVEVEINGQLISGGCASYNQLFNIIADTTFGEDCTNRRKILQNAGDVVAPAANVSAVQYAITNWLGFLGSVKPEVLDTNLLGNVRIRITLAPTDILVATGAVSSVSAVATGASYRLEDMYFTCDTISIDDGNFYAMHDAFLSQGGVYELPFNNYLSFSSSVATGAGALKFSLSTQSLNMVWATFVPTGTTAQLQVLNTDSATSTYFKRDGKGVIGWQQNINNVYYPNYRPDNIQAYQLMMNAYGLSQDTLGGCHRLLDTQPKWLDDFWTAVVNFAHPCDNDTERIVSGLDTRGNVAQCFFEYAGLTTAGTGLIFAQTSSLLRVGAGRQIEVVM